MTRSCVLCPELVRSRKKIVWGETYSYRAATPQVMAILESPGPEENFAGRPAIGTSGQEARHNLDINGITGRGVWLDNIIKCHPDNNRDPKQGEIARCTIAHLIPTITKLKPHWIITMGRYSTRFLLGDVDMEMMHGIPRSITMFGYDFVVIPTYHPTAGLHDPNQMILFQSDMKVAGDVIRGKILPRPPKDEFAGKENYSLCTGPRYLNNFVGGATEIAVDTEWARGEPWCLSVSVSPGSSIVVKHGDQPSLDALNARTNYGDTTTIIHNAAYDLPVLDKMGVRPAKVADTMVMAYLLQNEPQGLKPLAYRHCGMHMNSYSEMVAEATERMAMEYLMEVVSRQWPDPEPVLEWKGG